MNIILHLLQLIQYQHKQICWLLNFICRYIPLRQWAFDDSHSPQYQKFKIDKLPVIKTFIKQDWQFLLEYYQWKYGKPVKPVQRRNGKSIPEDTICPLCGAPHHYIYDNNGGNGQYQCKICGQTFCSGEFVTTPILLTCPHCGNTLAAKKNRKFFRIHKCVNPKCPYYLHNLKKVAQKDLYNISISHQQIASCCKTAAICVKPFVDHYDYKPGKVFTADGYSAYPLAAMEFVKRFKDTFTFNITQVIGLTNDDDVSKEFRPFKQMIERLNRTCKASYRPTNCY